MLPVNCMLGLFVLAILVAGLCLLIGASLSNRSK